MAQFAYSARDRTGQRVDGIFEGISAADVAARLVAEGRVPIKIRPASDGEKIGGATAFHFGTGVSDVEVLMFCRQMATLLRAGVPIRRALGGLFDSTANKRFKLVIGEVQDGLEGGRDFSQALGIHPEIFSPFVLAMVRVGENTGRLEDVFLSLFKHLEFQKFMRDQVKAALRYPSFVVLAMAGALGVINIFVIPSFARTFAGQNAELPLMTRFLIGFSNFTVNWWWAIALAAGAAVFAFKYFVSTKRGGYLWDKRKLRLPIAGPILSKASHARFARSLGLALKSGVTIVQGLTLVQEVVENNYLAAKLEQMRLSVARGDSVLKVSSQSGIFNPLVLQMIMVGEESGLLDEMLMEVADMYQQDVEYDLKNLSAQIEPILIVGLGGIVLVLALGIFLPI